MHIRRISKGNLRVLLLQPTRGQSVCRSTSTFLEKEFLTRKASGRTVQLEEVRDKPLGEDTTSDAIMAELVSEPVVEVAPAPRRSERLRNIRNVLLLDNDEPLT